MICLPEAPAGLIQAAVKQGGQFHPGFLCYGVLIEDEYVSAMLDKKVIVLEALRQCMWVMLRSSISQKLEMAKITAERIDKQQLQVIQKILGYPPQME